ncbi:MAG: hypothetical protein EAZ77_01245 [Nostocales cyanobacterium]|nr:MAG: hypothetical protein EAZ77_01245 [Nostocales cyanobacterium]
MTTLNKLGQFFSQTALRSLSLGVAAGSVMLALGVAKPASAVVIGGVDLSDDGFASRVISRTGSFATSGGSISSVLIDKNVSTYAYSTRPGTSVTLGFNNPIINGTGFDLALFDLDESLAIFNLTIAGITKSYQSFFTGTFTDDANQYPINVAKVNLDDFGIRANDSINRLTIGFDTNESPSLALVGTLTRSVPEPSAMFGILATAGFLACQRKFKLAKKA